MFRSVITSAITVSAKKAGASSVAMFSTGKLPQSDIVTANEKKSESTLSKVDLQQRNSSLTLYSGNKRELAKRTEAENAKAKENEILAQNDAYRRPVFD